MFRERSNNEAGVGYGDLGRGVDELRQPPPVESVFLDESNAPEVSFDEDERRPEMLSEEGDIIDGVEAERGKRTGRGRKRMVGAMVVLVSLAIGVIVVWFMVGGGATRKARVAVNGNARNSDRQSEEGMTRQAIQELNAAPGVNLGDGSVVRLQPSGEAVQPVTQAISNGPVTELPPSVNPNLSSTVEAARPGEGGSLSGESKTAAAATMKTVSGAMERNNERSVRIGEEVPAVKPLAAPGGGDRGSDRRGDRGSVAVPPFGSMLPVRSLGMIYTLRSGGLVRFELTRDVKGQGWALPHGTVMVGALRGSEFDRAFISLVGFIDAESGKFVKITGDVLGSDGGGGVKGKRRKISSGWSKVLGKLGEAGLNAAVGLAGSVGRRPVIIADAFGGMGARVTGEFDGALFNKDRNVFVEVGAGTACYILITELPETIQGVDALAKFAGREVESRADSEQPRGVTGISERELAELIQSGDPEQIRAALPRMTAEMRRVASTVMGQGGQ
jgi:hypothetical protein